MKQEALNEFYGRDISELAAFLRHNFYILSFQRIVGGRGSYIFSRAGHRPLEAYTDYNIIYEIWGGDK